MPIVQTVLGTIEPNQLGRTLTHEHISLNFDGFYCDAPAEFKPYLEQEISLETIGYLRQYPYSFLENLHFHDESAHAATKKDIELYKKYGGGTIVENSSHGLRRDLKHMLDTSKSTGVHIIAGTGHYVHNQQAKEHANMTVEQMTDLYYKEIVAGVDVDGETVKCGFVGEVGSVYPIHDFEKRAIRATGEIQELLGCGVSFHPGRDSKAPFEIVRLYLEAGGSAHKCVMSHLDRTLLEMEQLLEFSELGCYLQYDLFGTECSFYQLNPDVDMPSDAQRIKNLSLLIKNGLVDRLLMSHDVHTKHRLTSFGGHGYHHVFMNILPRMLAKGLTGEQIKQITVTNPANWLQFSV